MSTLENPYSNNKEAFGQTHLSKRIHQNVTSFINGVLDDESDYRTPNALINFNAKQAMEDPAFMSLMIGTEAISDEMTDERLLLVGQDDIKRIWNKLFCFTPYNELSDNMEVRPALGHFYIDFLKVEYDGNYGHIRNRNHKEMDHLTALWSDTFMHTFVSPERRILSLAVEDFQYFDDIDTNHPLLQSHFLNCKDLEKLHENLPVGLEHSPLGYFLINKTLPTKILNSDVESDSNKRGGYLAYIDYLYAYLQDYSNSSDLNEEQRSSLSVTLGIAKKIVDRVLQLEAETSSIIMDTLGVEQGYYETNLAAIEKHKTRAINNLKTYIKKLNSRNKTT